MISEVKTLPATQQRSDQGIIMPLIGLGIIGIAAWKGFSIYQDWQSKKNIEKSQENILKHELSLKKTKEKISDIERKAYVTGINGYKKIVSINIINQVNEIINNFFIVLTDSNGIKKYIIKSEKDIKKAAPKIKAAIFQTPIKSLGTLQKVYNIYTNRNLLNDCQKLDLNTYTEIKTLFSFAFKKYGK